MKAAGGGDSETKIKFLLRQKDVARLRKHPALSAGFERAAGPSRQETVYFDDRRRTLRREDISLRVRHVGERRIQTVEALNLSASPIERGEWQSEISGSRPDLSAAIGTALRDVLPKLRGPLEPLFETRVARIEFPVQHGRSDITVALDEGEIDTGEVRAPICELELELTHGNRADLFRLAEQLQAKIPIDLSYATKSARGYALLGLADTLAGKAGNSQLPPGVSIADAFRALAQDCLRHIVENRAGVGRREPEALHQMRIGIRRLRTVLSLFRGVVDGPGAHEIKAELRWLRSQTGPARDLDVFIDEVIVPLRAQYRRERPVVRMHQHARKKRREAYSAARKAVLSPRFRALAVRLGAWIEDGDWRAEADALTRARQDAPVETYGAERLSALYRKVRKQGKRLRALDHEGRHRLRLQVKKLRYASEFLAALAADKKPRKRAQAMIGALRGLQDKLGGLNDISVRRSLAAEMAGRVKPGTKRRQSRSEQIFLAGLIASRQHAEFGSLIEEAERAFGAFRKIKPFWGAMAEFTELRALPPAAGPAAAQPRENWRETPAKAA